MYAKMLMVCQQSLPQNHKRKLRNKELKTG